MINKKVYSLIFFVCIAVVSSLHATLKKKGTRNSITRSLYQDAPQHFNIAMLDSQYQEPMQEQEIYNDADALTSNDTPSQSVVEQEKKEHVAQNPILPVEPENQAFAFSDNSSDIPLELRTEVKNPDDEMADALEVLNARKEESIEFHFENASLETLIQQIKNIFNVTFITDDAITSEPPKQGKTTIKGHKITFKTHKPLSRDAAWSLFTTFLEISGFTIIPMPELGMYRIQPIAQAEKGPIRSFIGTDPEELPSSDEIIRYVYFIKNSTLETITKVVNSLKSKSAPAIELKEHKAFLVTDKAYNIRVLMQIVKELDQTTRPQSMSVLKLHRADAQQVKDLYESLINPDQQAAKTRVFRPQQKTSSLYFPEDMKIIAEKRTNTLILLGPQDAIKKVEEFIVKYIDIDLEQPYSPLHVVELKYANAAAVADILKEVTKFGEETQAGRSGGVRGGDKFLKPMSFVAEEATNRLIVRGDYEDFLQVKESIIDKLDEQQPQVAIEVLILDMQDIDTKQLGAQIRSKVPGTNSLLGQNVQFQTSGLFAGNTTGAGIVQNITSNLGATKLLGNLISLVTGAGPGNTVLSLGHDGYGVWGVFQMLQTISNIHVVSNPFLVTTNKTKAVVSLGTTRRVVTGVVQGNTPIASQGDQKAALEVKITPQINSDGMISLDFEVNITEFTNPTNPTDASTSIKLVKSNAVVADQEILALGGLVRNKFSTNISKTPFFGDIPLLGWLFKNKSKAVQKQNLLILISARIVRPDENIKSNLNHFTTERHNALQVMSQSEVSQSDNRDPIHTMFFNKNKSDSMVEDFIFDRGKIAHVKQRERKKERRAKRDLVKQEKAAAKRSPRPVTRSQKKQEINLPLENEKAMMVHNTQPEKLSLSPQNELRV